MRLGKFISTKDLQIKIRYVYVQSLSLYNWKYSKMTIILTDKDDELVELL